LQGAFLAEENNGVLKISSREELQSWLESLPPEQGRWVAVAIAARAALRVVPLVARDVPRERNTDNRSFLKLTFAVLFADAVWRVAGKYPTRASALPVKAAYSELAYMNVVYADSAVSSVVYSSASVGGPLASAYDYAKSYRAAATATLEAAHATARATNNDDTTSIWAAVSRDANYITAGGTAQALSSLKLWPEGEPFWTAELLHSLREALPPDNDWFVWTDWYNRRLEGVSDPEEIELIFATVPEEERKAGAAAANKWIKERLEELQKKESPAPLAVTAPPPQPIENLPSPFTFGRNAAGQITIIAGPQNTPVIAFPGDDVTHRRWLETGRKLTERLIADLQAGKFHNVRSDYREGLERYISDLPPDPGAGNFLLADAEARMLHSLFAAEPHILAEPFAARLKIVLENHFALLGFYPEVARYLAAAREGQVTAPLPQEAIAGFGKVVIDNTPQAFTPEVSQGLREAEREAPKVELEPEDIRGGPPPVKPPAYPYDEPDPEKSRAYAMMSTFNALYKTVLETAKNEPSKIVNWIAIEEMLRPYAIKIIELLKTFTPSAF
jgi:hypothetical protein